MEIRGADQLIGALKRRATLDDVKDVVRLNASEMQRTAQRKAPVDTGFLRRSIELNILDNGFTGEVKATAEYAPYVEYGTRYRNYPMPFIRPAYHEQKGKFINDMKRLLK